MEIVVKYLQADKKSGILSYRRRFPKELVKFIPSASPSGRGRVEMKVSLHTPDIKRPGALELYAAIERDYQKIVDKALKVASGGYDRLEEPLIQFLASTYISNQLALDEAGRWKRPGPDFGYPRMASTGSSLAARSAGAVADSSPVMVARTSVTANI